MSIDAMPVAHPEEPIIPDLSEVFYHEVVVLINLLRFIRNVPCSGFERIFNHGICNPYIHQLTLIIVVVLIREVIGGLPSSKQLLRLLPGRTALFGFDRALHTENLLLALNRGLYVGRSHWSSDWSRSGDVLVRFEGLLDWVEQV